MNVVANVTLVGPVVHDEEHDLWVFTVICGSSEGSRARVDTVECVSPWLLESVRTGWLVALERSGVDVPGYQVRWFDTELEMARIAMQSWPDQFASAVARGEVEEAGGGTA